MRETMKALVHGERQGRKYNTLVTFTLVPPGATNYYGNGHYMDINIMGDTKRIDVRHAGTVDLKKLARIWLVDFFGDNLEEMKIVGWECAQCLKSKE